MDRTMMTRSCYDGQDRAVVQGEDEKGESYSGASLPTCPYPPPKKKKELSELIKACVEMTYYKNLQAW